MYTSENTLAMKATEKGCSMASASTSSSAFQRYTRRGSHLEPTSLSSGSKEVKPKNLVNSPIRFDSKLGATETCCNRKIFTKLNHCNKDSISCKAEQEIEPSKQKASEPCKIVYLFEAYKMIAEVSSQTFADPLKLEEPREELKQTESSNKDAKKSDLDVSFTYMTGTSSKRSGSLACSQEQGIMDALSSLKPKRFGDRPDVIYKTILRSFKKYYLKDFNDATDYKKMKRKMPLQKDLLAMASLYVKERIPESPYSDLSLFIAAVVQQKIPEEADGSERLQELSRTVGDVLYKFNKTKMNSLLVCPQFSYLLSKFLSIDDLFGFIGNKSSSPEGIQNLQDQIEFLRQQCSIVLGRTAL